MDQLISEIKIYNVESKQLNPRRDVLYYKGILDCPIYQNSGNIRIDGDSSSFYELKNVNFIYLISTLDFNLIINNSVLLNTQQFNYVNRYKYIDIAIQCKPKIPQVVEFVYGNLELGDEDKGISLINQKPTCGAKWDRVLKNIVLTIDDKQPNSPLIFSKVSNISVKI